MSCTNARRRGLRSLRLAARLAPAEILTRLVALNAERRAEEARGLVRWLRPDYQAAGAAPRPTAQPELDVAEGEVSQLPAWPSQPAEQAVALRNALAAAPAGPLALARRFRRAPRSRVEQMLDALVAMGQARKAENSSSLPS